MLLPYFDYADVIYHKSNSTDLNKLQRLQNRCLRICMGFDRMYSVDRAHKLTDVPFLIDRRKAHVLNFMFKREAWNVLSPAIRNTESFLAFKSLQKKEMQRPLEQIVL